MKYLIFLIFIATALTVTQSKAATEQEIYVIDRHCECSTGWIDRYHTSVKSTLAVRVVTYSNGSVQRDTIASWGGNAPFINGSSRCSIFITENNICR